jgi:hypothetical protein
MKPTVHYRAETLLRGEHAQDHDHAPAGSFQVSGCLLTELAGKLLPDTTAALRHADRIADTAAVVPAVGRRLRAHHPLAARPAPGAVRPGRPGHRHGHPAGDGPRRPLGVSIVPALSLTVGRDGIIALPLLPRAPRTLLLSARDADLSPAAGAFLAQVTSTVAPVTSTGGAEQRSVRNKGI